MTMPIMSSCRTSRKAWRARVRGMILYGCYDHIGEATLKKKFVSCPAGGRNCGQSGGRKILFFPCFFLWGGGGGG